MATDQTVLMQCLEAAQRSSDSAERWVTARAVARLLGPAVDPESIGRQLTRLHRVGLVEMWFRGGHSYYRAPR